MRNRVEPIAPGHGKARESLFVGTLCSSHEIGIHCLFRGAGHSLGPAHSQGMGASVNV